MRTGALPTLVPRRLNGSMLMKKQETADPMDQSTKHVPNDLDIKSFQHEVFLSSAKTLSLW